MPAIEEASLSWLDSEAARKVAKSELTERRAMIQDNWAYYEGKHRPSLSPDGKADNNVVMNMCEIVVDYTVSYLFPDMPRIELEEPQETDDEEELRDFWERSGGATLMTKNAINGAVAGHCFMRLVVDGTGQPEKYVTLDPRNVIVWWHDDDVDNLFAYELRWESGKTQYRQNIVRDPDNALQWLVVDYVGQKSGMSAGGGKDNWMMLDEPVIWPHILPPVVDWQHLPVPNRYYGKAELHHKNLNDSVNKTASDVKSILRYHAYPKIIAIGVNPEDENSVKTGINQVMFVGSPDAKIEMLEMTSDLASSMNYLSKLENMFYSISRTVVFTGDIDIFRGMTNLGVRTAFMPMTIKNNTLRREYQRGIVGLSLLWQLAMGVAEPVVPKIYWSDALPKDHVEEMRVLESERRLGIISKRQAADIRGRRYDVVREDLEEEALEDDLFAAPTVEEVGIGIPTRAA